MRWKLVIKSCGTGTTSHVRSGYVLLSKAGQLGQERGRGRSEGPRGCRKQESAINFLVYEFTTQA